MFPIFMQKRTNTLCVAIKLFQKGCNMLLWTEKNRVICVWCYLQFLNEQNKPLK